MQLIWRIVHQRGNKENIKIRLNIFYQFIKRIIVQHLTFTDFIKSLIKSVFFAFSIRYFTISFCDSMSNAIFQCRPPLRCDGIMYDTCAIRQDAARLVLYLTQCHIFIPCHNESFIFCKYTSFPRTAQGTKRKTPGREASRLAAGRKIVLWSNAFERSRLYWAAGDQKAV